MDVNPAGTLVTALLVPLFSSTARIQGFSKPSFDTRPTCGQRLPCEAKIDGIPKPV